MNEQDIYEVNPLIQCHGEMNMWGNNKKCQVHTQSNNNQHLGQKWLTVLSFWGKNPIHTHTRARAHRGQTLFVHTRDNSYYFHSAQRVYNIELDPPTAYMYHPRLTESYITIQNL